jgi:hypothetical protein
MRQACTELLCDGLAHGIRCIYHECSMYLNACASKGSTATNAAYCRPVIISAPPICAIAADATDCMHDCAPTDFNDRQLQLPAVLPESQVPVRSEIVLSRIIAPSTQRVLKEKNCRTVCRSAVSSSSENCPKLDHCRLYLCTVSAQPKCRPAMLLADHHEGVLPLGRRSALDPARDTCCSLNAAADHFGRQMSGR